MKLVLIRKWLERINNLIQSPLQLWNRIILFIIIFVMSMMGFILGIRHLNEEFIVETKKILRTTLQQNLADLVKYEGEMLGGVVRDYSCWNELYYGYMVHPTAAFEKGTLQDTNLENLKVNFILILDQKGNIYFYNDLNQGEQGYDPDFPVLLQKNINLLYAKEEVGQGFANIRGKIFLIGYHSILESQRKESPRGVLVMGKEVNDTFLTHMSRIRGGEIGFSQQEGFDSQVSPSTGDIHVENPVIDMYGNVIGYFKHTYPLVYIKDFDKQVNGQIIFVVFITLIFSVSFVLIIASLYRKNQEAILKEVNEKERLLEEISQVNQQMEQDLRLAADYQRSMLPYQFPYPACIDWHYSYIPSAKVGGDLFGIIDLEDERFGIWIADASGHGVRAAMLAMFIKSVFTPQDIGYISPEAALYALNQKLNGKLGDGFVTMFVAIVDLKEYTVSYAGAGHIDQLWWDKSKGEFFHLKSKGIPIGIMPDVTYTKGKIEFEPGDQFMFLTDGVVELESDMEQIFDFSALKLYLKNHMDTEQEKVSDSLYHYLLSIANTSQLEDDFTFVTLKTK